MKLRKPGRRRTVIAWFTALFILSLSAVLSFAADDPAIVVEEEPKWVRTLPAKTCPGASHSDCHNASPVLADLTADGKLEIIVATNNGYVLAFRQDGSELWRTDIAPAFGMASGQQVITASPAVADIDNDGRLEVVVGAGTIHPSVCTKGGVIVLDHNGHAQPGWPFITKDKSVAPSGCPDSVYSTPALGDLDRDGDLEIVFGSFDHTLYALHHNGQFVAGFPPNSHLYQRFGWSELEGRLADTIWSSPALADINGDGYLEIIVGSDEGNFDSRHEPAQGNWTCPYAQPLKPGYCGGSIYAFDHLGREVSGFPRYKYEIIQSSPAVFDINGDDRGEIFVGTGTWYYRMSSDHPTLGFRLFGLDHQGNDLPGWEGGKVTGGTVPASPSIGDITGDGKPNVVVVASDQRLYAWHINGQPVAGFPMKPRNQWGQVHDKYDVGASPMLADFTGDGQMEIILRHSWEIVVVNGRGQQLTATNADDGRPVFTTEGTIMNNPAVGDIDGDGRLELVVHNSQLYVWDLPGSGAEAQWPMFKRNAARTSFLGPAAQAYPHEFNVMAGKDKPASYSLQLNLTADFDEFNWQVRSDQPSRITFSQTSGIVDSQHAIVVKVDVPAGLPLGENLLGTIQVSFTQSDGDDLQETIPVKAKILDTLQQAYMPSVR